MTTVALLMTGGVSWVLRVAFIAMVPIRKLPDRARRILDAAGPAVLAAMVATSLTHEGGAATLVTPSPLLAATVLSAAVAWRTQRTGLTVVVGIGSLWLLQFVLLGERHV